MKIEVLKEVDLTQLKQLVKLEQEAFGIGGMNEWHLVPFIRHGRVYVASEQEKAVGMVQYMCDWDNPYRAYMVGVSVDSGMRGRGIGTNLIRFSLMALKKEHIKEVELTVDPQNVAAINIYEGKFGFMTKCLRVDEYGKGESRLVMMLSLDQLL